jgi:hypothetical protein
MLQKATDFLAGMATMVLRVMEQEMIYIVPGGALLIGVDQDPSAAIFNAIARHRAVYDIYYLAVRHLISLRGSYQTSNFTKSFSYIPLSTSIEVRCIDCLLLPLPRHRPSGPG